MPAGNLNFEHVVQDLAQLNERANLDALPEVQAMRQIVLGKPSFDQDGVARLCVAAALNNYQERIAANPDKESYWGRFIDWAVTDGEGNPPWQRFPNRKAIRFETFRTSALWNAKLLNMDSGHIRQSLAEVMRQRPLQKTVCYAPLVVARWAYVLERPFTVVSDHPLPIDIRISRLLQRNPQFEPCEVIRQANERRRKLGRRDLDISDFDAWLWQGG